MSPTDTLAEWVLREVRLLIPDDPIFDGVLAARTFDGVDVPDAARQWVSLHIPEPAHESVALRTRSDRVELTITAHSFGTSLPEVRWRQKRVTAALLDRIPEVTGFEFSTIEHPVSRAATVDYSVAGRIQLQAIDQFDVAGFISTP